MRCLVRNFLAATALLYGCALASTIPSVFAADSERAQAEIQADHALVAAVAKADKTAVRKLLDASFTWTDVQGKTQNKEQVLQALPAAALGDESGLDVKERTYGQVGAIIVGKEKLYVLRV